MNPFSRSTVATDRLFPHRSENPRLRMAAFERRMAANPGAAPGGTGSTGLMSGDARGYSELLGDQRQFLDDQRAVAGRGPMNVEYGGDANWVAQGGVRRGGPGPRSPILRTGGQRGGRQTRLDMLTEAPLTPTDGPVQVLGPRRDPDAPMPGTTDFQDMRLGGGVSSRGVGGGSVTAAAGATGRAGAYSSNDAPELLEQIRSRRIGNERRDTLEGAETAAAANFVPSAVRARGEGSAAAQLLAEIKARGGVDAAKARAQGTVEAARVRGQRDPAEPLDYADTAARLLPSLLGPKGEMPAEGTPTRLLIDYLLQQSMPPEGGVPDDDMGAGAADGMSMGGDEGGDGDMLDDAEAISILVGKGYTEQQARAYLDSIGGGG